MQTKVDEIADGTYRLSTFVPDIAPPAGFTFNQFLVLGDDRGEDVFKYSTLNPGMGATLRGLSKLAPRTLALMHGPSSQGDGGAALRALADDYDRRVRDQVFAARLNAA